MQSEIHNSTPNLSTTLTQRMECVISLFEHQAVYKRNHIAIICRDSQLTFRQLSERVDHLALRFLSHNIDTNSIVAIYLDRSIESIVAILATLKLGASYLPLSSAWPVDFSQRICQDVRPNLVITFNRYKDRVQAWNIPSMLIDMQHINPHFEKIECPSFKRNLDAPACHIYSSGTTGNRKIVTLTHRNFAYCRQALQGLFGLTAQDICLHNAPFGFVVSIRQLFVPLCEGAAVALATVDQLQDPLQIFRFIKTHSISHINLVPSFARECMASLKSLRPQQRQDLLGNNLRQVSFGGEALMRSDAKAWETFLGPDCDLFGLYGQTETTGPVAAINLRSPCAAKNNMVPIGLPFPGANLEILDNNGNPVARKAEGTIYASSPGLAMGYFENQTLSQKNFVALKDKANPFFNTGDIGRRLPNGTIEFLGRADNCDKIRGFKVDLLQIESVLLENPLVESCAVVTSRQNKEAKLVAFIKPCSAAQLTGSSLYDI